MLVHRDQRTVQDKVRTTSRVKEKTWASWQAPVRFCGVRSIYHKKAVSFEHLSKLHTTKLQWIWICQVLWMSIMLNIHVTMVTPLLKPTHVDREVGFSLKHLVVFKHKQFLLAWWKSVQWTSNYYKHNIFCYQLNTIKAVAYPVFSLFQKVQEFPKFADNRKNARYILTVGKLSRTTFQN